MDLFQKKKSGKCGHGRRKRRNKKGGRRKNNSVGIGKNNILEAGEGEKNISDDFMEVDKERVVKVVSKQEIIMEDFSNKLLMEVEEEKIYIKMK